jgi:hypothetical protein
LGKRNHIDGLAGVPEIDNDFVNRLVRWDEKMFLTNFSRAFRYRLTPRDQH